MIQCKSYVCISCGSITETKNLSLTAFAITAAADWKTAKKNKNLVQPSDTFKHKNNFFYCEDYDCNVTHENTVSQHEVMDLLSLLDELVTVI